MSDSENPNNSSHPVSQDNSMQTRVMHVPAGGLDWFLDVLFRGLRGGQSWINVSAHETESEALAAQEALLATGECAKDCGALGCDSGCVIGRSQP